MLKIDILNVRFIFNGKKCFLGAKAAIYLFCIESVMAM